MSLLVLFDVDGTLFLTHDALSGQALRETLEAHFGVHLPDDAVERVPHPGQTSLKIARLILQHAGLDDHAVEADLRDWCPEFAARYLELLGHADTSTWEAAPGAAAALSRLQAAGLRLALWTGNPEPMARARMKLLGLDAYFPAGQGAFGCDSESRGELLDLARERAGGWPAAETSRWATPRATSRPPARPEFGRSSSAPRVPTKAFRVRTPSAATSTRCPRDSLPGPGRRRAGARLCPWRRRPRFRSVSSSRLSRACRGSARSIR